MGDRACTGFEAQRYLRDRCRKCFRLRDKHAEVGVTGLTVPDEDGNNDRRADDHKTSIGSEWNPILMPDQNSRSDQNRSVLIRSNRSPILTVRRTPQQYTTLLRTSTTPLARSSSATKQQPPEMRRIQVENAADHANPHRSSSSSDNKQQPQKVPCIISLAKKSDTKVPNTTTTKAPAGKDADASSRPTASSSSSSAIDNHDNGPKSPPTRPSSTTTVLLSKQRQISLGHSKSLREKSVDETKEKKHEDKEEKSNHARKKSDSNKEEQRRQEKKEYEESKEERIQKAKKEQNHRAKEELGQEGKEKRFEAKDKEIGTKEEGPKNNRIIDQKNKKEQKNEAKEELGQEGKRKKSEAKDKQNDEAAKKEQNQAGVTREKVKAKEEMKQEDKEERKPEREKTKEEQQKHEDEFTGRHNVIVTKEETHDIEGAEEEQQQRLQVDDLRSVVSSSYRSAMGGGPRSASPPEADSTEQLFTAYSVESLTSLSWAESFKTGVDMDMTPFMTPTNSSKNFFEDQELEEDEEGGEDEDGRALTPTAKEFNQWEFAHLRTENRRLQDQCRRYRHERKRWSEWLKKRYGTWKEKDNGDQREDRETGDGRVAINGKQLVEEALAEMELLLNDYRTENSALKAQLLGQTKNHHDADSTMSASALTLTNIVPPELEERLQMSESMCEQLQKERKELERELEEMQDQYRVEEIQEFRELQRELEQSAKNARILQFKLRKADRLREQLQAEKGMLARRVQELQGENAAEKEADADRDSEVQNGDGTIDEKEVRRVAELEQDLRVTREVSLRLNIELEAAEERRCKLEDELFHQKEQVRELLAQNRWREARHSNDQQKPLTNGTSSAEGLPKEVRDILEREADLREQLRFTEGDLHRTRQRMHELEHENDELLQRYTQLTDRQSSQMQQTKSPLLLEPGSRRTSMLRSRSEGTGASWSPMQLRNNKKFSSQELTATGEVEEQQLQLKRKSAENERQIALLREEAETLRSSNTEMTAKLERMKEELDMELRKSKEDNEMKIQTSTKQLEQIRKELDSERTKREASETALAENRAVMEKLNSTILSTGTDLEQARRRVVELEQELARTGSWETRCQEMKQERIRVQAEAVTLKKRTEEALRELEKITRTHQQKEIGWLREKSRLEEQLRGKQQQQTISTTQQRPLLTSTSTTSMDKRNNGVAVVEEGQLAEEPEKQETNNGILPTVAEGSASSTSSNQQQGNNVAVAVDYKQIADSALKAAESLQKQYREYQRQYTAEVQRLNAQLKRLEQELAQKAAREAELQRAAAPMQAQRPTRGYESPSMSSLTDNNFTDNTTWDSRLLDRSSLMTRSMSPLKVPTKCAKGLGGPNLMMMMQSRNQQHQYIPQSPIMTEVEQRRVEDVNFGSDEEDLQQKCRRTSSTGTNILYRIRREELSKGKKPSVRQMAHAFDSFEKFHKGCTSEEPRRKKIKVPKSGGFFSLLGKSNSMEASSLSEKILKTPKGPRRGEAQQPVYIGTRENWHESSPSPSVVGFGGPSSTLPRGGRNPFKGLSSRIVERVRRSLSRSKKSLSRDGTPSLMLNNNG